MKHYSNLVEQMPMREFVEKALKHELKTWLPTRATVSVADYTELADSAGEGFEYAELPDELGVIFEVNGKEHTVILAHSVLQASGSLVIT